MLLENLFLDRSKVFWLLSGLGPQYESFATTMLKPPVPFYADLIPLLQSHELRYKGHQSELVNYSMAFYGQQYGGDNNKNKYNNKKRGQSFTSKGKGFPQTGQRNSSTRDLQEHGRSDGEHGVRSSQDQNAGGIITCQICKKRGHDALKCLHRFNNSFQAEDIPRR